MATIQVKRVYEPVSAEDGLRILVDRVWPRGQRKESVACPVWAKAVTPSTPLRKAFHAGDVARTDFAATYRAELARNPEFPAFAEQVHEALEAGNVTLVTAAHLTPGNHCEVLRAALTDAW